VISWSRLNGLAYTWLGQANNKVLLLDDSVRTPCWLTTLGDHYIHTYKPA